MTKHISTSKLKSQLRRAEQQQRQAINKYNQAVRKYNRDINRLVSDYNSAVRKHNANVRRNRRIIKSELIKLNTATAVHTSYTVSSRTMQQHYEEIGMVYCEGTFVTREQDNILDLIEQEQANSLITENCIEGDLAPDENPEDIEIGNKLALISEDLNNRWKGAVFALSPDNPDAARHFCTSTREIFTEFLEIKAPDDLVVAYNPRCEKTKEGNPTRKEKIRYMMRSLNMDDSVISFVEEDIKNILELNQLLSGGTHGPAGKYSFEKLFRVKTRVEQGINFLFEISRGA